MFLLTSVSLGWHRLQNGMQQLGQYLPNSVTDRPWCVNMGIKYLCGGGVAVYTCSLGIGLLFVKFGPF